MTSDPKPCELSCPKCGSAECNRVYVDNGGSVRNEDYGKCNNRFSDGQCNQYFAWREHIDHTCRTCTHRWQTPPLPKPKRAKVKIDAAKVEGLRAITYETRFDGVVIQHSRGAWCVVNWNGFGTLCRSGLWLNRLFAPDEDARFDSAEDAYTALVLAMKSTEGKAP